ncbi:MAG TPA: PPC domain-containing DNA-binding protein [Bryobacteraceae bacterium]|nr:PPC domain-containing DNA-binding protein [Bryobacteraceae bacterium]
MKSKLLAESPEKTFAVIFGSGDEAMAGLLSFAKENGLKAAHFTGIGAFEDVTLGYFEWKTKQYARIPLREQVEAISIAGDIALEKGEPKVHAHIVVGRYDGTTRGGHFLEGHVRPTLEIILVESPAILRREMDEESGLALIRL